MTREDLIEKVARAMLNAVPGNALTFGWQEYLPEATSAIDTIAEAMREPTPEMIAAIGGAPRTCATIYRRMLAASPLAIKDGGVR